MPAWTNIRIKKQCSWLEKTKFFEFDRPIGRISYGAFDGRAGSELAVLQTSYDETGPAADITFVSLSGNVIGSRRVYLENRENPEDLSIIDVDGDGYCEFLVGVGRLLDHNGKLMASFFTSHPAGYRWVDYDRDGALDFYTFMGGSFKVVDRFGRTLDEWPLETYLDRSHMRQLYLYDARLLDFDQDELCDRVYVTRRERSYRPYEYKLHIHSGDKKVSRTMAPPRGGWAVSPFPRRPGRQFLLQYVGQELLVLPFDGSAAVARLESDGVGLSTAIGAVAELRPGQEFLLVAWHVNYQGRLVGYSEFRLFLNFFDDKGSLVYSEVLDSVYGATDRYVAFVPVDAHGAASLFVAEGRIVWRYAARLVEG